MIPTARGAWERRQTFARLTVGDRRSASLLLVVPRVHICPWSRARTTLRKQALRRRPRLQRGSGPTRERKSTRSVPGRRAFQWQSAHLASHGRPRRQVVLLLVNALAKLPPPPPRGEGEGVPTCAPPRSECRVTLHFTLLNVDKEGNKEATTTLDAFTSQVFGDH